MWFKPEGWENLSEEDQRWVKEISGPLGYKRALFRALPGCVEKNEAIRVRFILQNGRLGRSELRSLTMSAVKASAAEALDALLAHRQGFDFSSKSGGDREHTSLLFNTARTGSLAAWKVLHDWNLTSSYGKISKEEVINSFVRLKDTSADIVRFEMQKNPEKFILSATDGPVDALKLILACLQKSDHAQFLLNEALIRAAKNGREEHAQLLLSKGADPNYKIGLALQEAIQAGNQKIFDLLLPRVRLGEHGENILVLLKQAGTQSVLFGALVKAVQKEKISPLHDNGYVLVDAETLSETQQLPDMKLTTLFNFRTCQQVSILEKTDKAGGLTMAVTSFDDIGNEDLIETLRQKLVDMGGTPGTPGRLEKPALKRAMQ